MSRTEYSFEKPDPADAAVRLARLVNSKLGTSVDAGELQDFVFSYFGSLSILAHEIHEGERK